jgi:hypothetical protein
MPTKETHKIQSIRIPLHFYEQVSRLVDGIEVQSFSHLILVSLKKYYESQVVSPLPSSTPPPNPPLESPSLTPPLISPLGDIYPPLDVSPSEPEEERPVNQASKKRRRRITYSNEFSAFWNLYPHSRGGKEKTFEEFKTVVSSGLATEDDLLEAARVYRDRCERDRVEPKYIKQPINWLKDRRWEDEDKSGKFSVLPELKANPNRSTPVFLD